MVTVQSSDNGLLGDFTVTLHKFKPLLNFNSTRNELFVTVEHEKYTAMADWACPSVPGTSLFATKEISLEESFDFIFSISTVGKSEGKKKIDKNLEEIRHSSVCKKKSNRK